MSCSHAYVFTFAVGSQERHEITVSVAGLRNRVTISVDGGAHYVDVFVDARYAFRQPW